MRAAASAYTYGLISSCSVSLTIWLHLVDPPALAEVGDVVADAGHLLLVGAAEPEHELGVRRLDHVAPRDQAVPVEGTAEGERARLGDHRLVEIEERGTADHGAQV